MTATNHVVTGSLFATVVRNPAVALPVAFLLHFAMDALPHYGYRGNPDKGLQNLKWVLPLDAAAASVVLALIALIQPDHWIVIALGGVLCASPDLFHIPRYIRYLRTKNSQRYGDWFSRFHSWIQWGERPWGIYVEGVWLVVFGTLLLHKL